MRFYVLVVAILIGAAALLLSVFGPNTRTLVDIILVVGAMLPLVIRHTPRLYLWLGKLGFAIRNTPATWDLEGRFRDTREDLTPQGLAQTLICWAGDDSSVITQGRDRTVVRLMRRFVLEIYRPPQPDELTPSEVQEPEVALSISPITVGYRDSKRFLENELLPLFEKANTELRASWASFSLRVDLPERNPFYGFYLQQFNLDAVSDFRVEFHIPAPFEHSRVTVGKKRLTVVSDTLEGFRSAVSAALAFQVPEVKPCQ